MKTQTALIAFLFSATAGFSQIVIFEDSFDSYTVGAGTSSQSPVWETWTSGGGGANDAIVSDEHALSGTNAMKMVHDKDMIYPFNDISTGSFTIEFNAFMHDQAYFNLQHAKGTNWAVDIYLTDSNEIEYLEEDGIANAIVVGTYVNDQWTHFKFTVDLDTDTILFHVDGVLLYSSNFTNSLDGMPSNHLDVMNFYGLEGFNGVTESYFYVDDFKVTNLGATAGIEESIKPAITIFPNPAKDVVTITSAETIDRVVISDLSGKIIREESVNTTNFQFTLAGFVPGIYLVQVDGSAGQTAQKITVL